MGFEPENIGNRVRRAAAQRRRRTSARPGADGPERSARDERRSREQSLSLRQINHLRLLQVRAQTRPTETGDRLTMSWPCTMPRSLQREAEDAGPEYVSGRFAREGESAPGRPTPTGRRRGSVPAETSVTTAPDAFAEKTVQVYKAGDTGDGTTRSRVRILLSPPNK